MEYKDYYKILGVDRKASEEEIKRAYRKLVRQHHPDVNPDDPTAEERFKEINEAHEVLSDPEKRRKYERLGADWQRWRQAGGRPDGFDWGRWTTQQPGGGRVHVHYGDIGDLFGEASPFSDFFNAIFGGVGGMGGMGAAPGRTQYQPRSRQGQDYEQEVEITLEEAYRGARRLLSKDGKRLEVKIPPGVRTGSRVRIAGEGAAGIGGGQTGNLYLRVKIAPHPHFERKGHDLHCSVPLDLYTALLGGEVRVPTLDGDVQLKIPPETRNGRTFRLTGRGMPHLRQPEQRGDLYATVQVHLPQGLSQRERELVEELARLRDKN